jgi:hypothetical protein
VTVSSAPWRAAGVLLIAAGLVATAAAALHWSPCLGVSFDSAACMDRQHDYRYFLPLEHSFGWQPVWPAPQLTASAAIMAGGGWLFAQAGMKLSWSARVGAVLCATLPLAFGCQLMVGLIAGPAAAGELHATIGLLSVAVLAISGWLVVAAHRDARAPALPVAVLALLAVNAWGAPAAVLDYITASMGYASHDYPPFFGLRTGITVLGAGLAIAVLAGSARTGRGEGPSSPALAAGDALERTGHG